MNPTDPQLFNGLFQVNGATRLYGTIGDPIRQLRMTGVMPQVFAATGTNAVWLPFEGGADLLPLMLDALGKMRNLGGFTVTIPHKTSIIDMLGRATPRAVRPAASTSCAAIPTACWPATTWTAWASCAASRRRATA